MIRIFVIGSVLTASVAAAAAFGFAAQRKGESGGTSGVCQVVRAVTALRGLPEASGLALSRVNAGMLWSHNDSGEPVVQAIDAQGAVRGSVRVTGAQVRDWEDVSVGPCGKGSCLYVADIGDNNSVRSEITVYRVPEPRAGEAATAPAEAFTGTYPDGRHDAEALFVTPSEEIFVITKESAGQTALYRMAASQSGSRTTLQLVSKLPIARVTDAEVSPDGAWVAVRSNDSAFFYRTRELIGGAASEPRRFELRDVREPQGEGIAIAADGTVYLAGEGGGAGGTFAALRCALR